MVRTGDMAVVRSLYFASPVTPAAALHAAQADTALRRGRTLCLAHPEAVWMIKA